MTKLFALKSGFEIKPTKFTAKNGKEYSKVSFLAFGSTDGDKINDSGNTYKINAMFDNAETLANYLPNSTMIVELEFTIFKGDDGYNRQMIQLKKIIYMSLADGRTLDRRKDLQYQQWFSNFDFLPSPTIPTSSPKAHNQIVQPTYQKQVQAPKIPAQKPAESYDFMLEDTGNVKTNVVENNDDNILWED